MPAYPVSRVKRVVVQWRALVAKSEPDFEARKRKQPEYEFSNGKVFYGNPEKRGAYADD